MKQLPWKAESLVDLRRFAVQLVLDGEEPSEVAESFGVARRSVERWRRIFREGGDAALQDRPRSGRPPKLDKRQTEMVLDWITQDPCSFGFSTQRWTAPRVALVLQQRLGITMHPRYLNDWLSRHGISPQIPPRQAAERDEDRIANWVHYQWPRIKKSEVIARNAWFYR